MLPVISSRKKRISHSLLADLAVNAVDCLWQQKFAFAHGFVVEFLAEVGLSLKSRGQWQQTVEGEKSYFGWAYSWYVFPGFYFEIK